MSDFCVNLYCQHYSDTVKKFFLLIIVVSVLISAASLGCSFHCCNLSSSVKILLVFHRAVVTHKHPTYILHCILEVYNISASIMCCLILLCASIQLQSTLCFLASNFVSSHLLVGWFPLHNCYKSSQSSCNYLLSFCRKTRQLPFVVFMVKHMLTCSKTRCNACY